MLATMTIDETISAAETSKQATKALKCVAFTSKQVGDMLFRKHERVTRRIQSICEEIESLKTDVAENVTHQRERRQQLTEVEEDLEHAQLLGNATLVNELLDEVNVLKEEAKREEALYRAICRTIRSRKDTKRQFVREKSALDEELRNFNFKQKLIQTLLATCSRQSVSSNDTQGSSASQSDCGASEVDDSPESSSISSEEETKSEPISSPEVVYLRKSVSMGVNSPPIKRQLRVRSFSSDCVPSTKRESFETRPRHSLSVHFASPELTYMTDDAEVGEELRNELEVLDISSSLTSIAEVIADIPQAEDTTTENIETLESGVEVEVVTEVAEEQVIVKEEVSVVEEVVSESAPLCEDAVTPVEPEEAVEESPVVVESVVVEQDVVPAPEPKPVEKRGKLVEVKMPEDESDSDDNAIAA
ncbi:hypothetical protein Poli38472_011951 [Pythium oligandrum]|uniref:Uncharacterized protein n=1 Tax=Pythium oligandrum TaxID=41045 RepID=A0A8K1CNY9_PYTOL|nr:hypothetical protein Poli38472_011951 [Pythium oligandrum]|eukprot:TMW66835.1 hypothetical protein Poli38472_011951 [Pythium oligandrum]